MSNTIESRSVLIVADQEGETRLYFSPDNETEVNAAQKMFAAKKKSGYIAYCTKRDDSASRLIIEFDPDAETITLSPPLIGG